MQSTSCVDDVFVGEILASYPPTVELGGGGDTFLERVPIALESFTSTAIRLESGVCAPAHDVMSEHGVVRQLLTDDLDEFKKWIGVSDREIETGIRRPSDLKPSAPFSAQLLRERDELSDRQWRDIELSANAYLFGSSALVRSFVPAIHKHLSPFQAVLYAVGRCEILPGAVLEVAGLPTVLVFHELVIHEGGAIKLYTPVKLLARSVRKERR